MAVRNLVDPILNKIGLAEYNGKVAAGMITDTMIEEQVWIHKDVTIPMQHKLIDLKPVATSGSYNDLTDKPTIPDLNDITCSTVGAIPVAQKGAANGVATLDENGKVTNTQLPEIAYSDITGTPTLFSGSYNDLTDKPTIPSVTGLASESYVNTKVADLVNSAPTTLDTLGEVATAIQNNATVVEALNNAIGTKANISTVTALETRVTTAEGTITSLQTNKANTSDLATVATSGSYNDLTDKPTIGSTVLKIWTPDE